MNSSVNVIYKLHSDNNPSLNETILFWWLSATNLDDVLHWGNNC